MVAAGAAVRHPVGGQHIAWLVGRAAIQARVIRRKVRLCQRQQVLHPVLQPGRLLIVTLALGFGDGMAALSVHLMEILQHLDPFRFFVRF